MRDDIVMRTTLDLDDDILQAAKDLASHRRTTTGKVISELARKGLAPAGEERVRNGVPVLVRRPGAPRLTLEQINELRDEL
jgi:hypothetical protein